jgi:hypothetical protein
MAGVVMNTHPAGRAGLVTALYLADAETSSAATISLNPFEIIKSVLEAQ